MITSLLVIMLIIGVWSAWFISSLGGYEAWIYGPAAGFLTALFIILPLATAMIHVIR